MKRKQIVIHMLIFLFCYSLALPAVTYAEQAPSFQIAAHKLADGKVIVKMNGNKMKDLYGYEARFTFDPERVELVETASSLDGFSVSPIIKNNEIIIAHTKIGNVSGEYGDIPIGSLTFKMKNHGTSVVRWESMKVVDHNLSNQTFSIGKSITVAKFFVDLEGHWAKTDIELLASKNIVKGMDEDHYAPDAQVTRAQFVALIARALNLKASSKQSPFTDVAPGSWYEKELKSAYSTGIIRGITETSFAPGKKITREEMAVMIVRARNYASDSALRDLADADSVMTFADSENISEWAKKEIQLAVGLGIMNGRTKIRFVPQDQATRAEAATVIRRLLTSLNLL
ncbi:S-layer homology domain-containing protein [Cohnella phaseoli]|uniref:S-layer family protein n=1 Tax=Cohnella phaseoli TaxID=456490 RepID=A0A3D9HTU7_9BACL|nr:S-layer homology domain-containing protein [Cohnella phaseoli]RED52781.1 S-layer family protein [Cohnella phaseoli]